VIQYNTFAQADFQFVSVRYPTSIADEHRDALVDGIAIEDACNRLGQYGPNASHLDDHRGMLAAGAKTEVASANKNIARNHSAGKTRNPIFERMSSKLWQIAPQVRKPSWDYVVGRDIIPGNNRLALYRIPFHG
jgi:hypothetical protein